MSPTQRGFTLLELLVAIAIFALLGVGSYRLLASTISTRDSARSHDAALMQLQKAFTIMGRDFSQAAPRPVRDEYGDEAAAVVLKNNALDLTRAGWPNPLQQARSELQRVRYELNDKHELVRQSWPQLDRERGTRPQQSVLLKQVESVQIKAYSGTGRQEAEWPVFTNQPQAADAYAPLSELPRALEVVISIKPWGEVRRFFLLPQNATTPETQKNAS